MDARLDKTGDPLRSASAEQAHLHQNLRRLILVLAAINGLGTAYYIAWIFFYMERNFHFTKADNLLLAACYGFTYMVAAYSYGGLARRFGHLRLLWTGLLGMTALQVVGCVVSWTFGHIHPVVYVQFVILMGWAVGTSLTWPALQALLSRESPGELPKTVGIYNLLWAGGGAISQFTGGAFFDHLGGEMVFWLPVTLNAVQLAIVGKMEQISAIAGAPPAVIEGADEPHPSNPRSTERSRAFLRLAWAANPFCYIAVYSFTPLLPYFSDRLGLTTTGAGMIFSTWFWSRLVAFTWFWLWPGWHYRFRWLLTAFLAMIASFAIIVTTSSVWVVIAAQIAFGLAIGLIYYSSLYYSMDVGASKSKRGGIHEAVIGFGIGAGPAAGYVAVRIFPTHPGAIAWNVGGVLCLGLLLFLAVRFKRWEKAS